MPPQPAYQLVQNHWRFIGESAAQFIDSAGDMLLDLDLHGEKSR